MTHLCWWIYIFLFRSLPSSSLKLTSPFPVAEQKLERTNTFVYMLKQQHWFAHTISTIVLISDFNFSGILFMLHMNKDRWWTYHRQKPQSASRGSNRRKQRNHGLHIELGMPNGKNLSAPIYIRMSLIVDVKFFLGERMDTVWWHDNVKHMLKQCSIETSPMLSHPNCAPSSPEGVRLNCGAIKCYGNWLKILSSLGHHPIYMLPASHSTPPLTGHM